MKSLLLTGASGFVGRNIYPLLSQNYHVTTCGRNDGNDIISDLSNYIPEFPNRYDVVVHAAGKAHSVPKNEREAQVFYDVNLQGTKNLCKGLERTRLPHSFIFISTVAVYGCDEGEDIDERNLLNGQTHYAKSKIAAEHFLTDWCSEHHVVLTILRPSLIAGPNPPGNLGAMIRGIKTGFYFRISNGKVRKSILMVDDINQLIMLAQEKGGVYNVCDDNHPSFCELETIICKQLGKKEPIDIPCWMAKFLAFIGDFLGSRAPFNTKKLNKLSRTITFSNERAKSTLGWQPMSVLENFKIEE